MSSAPAATAQRNTGPGSRSGVRVTAARARPIADRRGPDTDQGPHPGVRRGLPEQREEDSEHRAGDQGQPDQPPGHRSPVAAGTEAHQRDRDDRAAGADQGDRAGRTRHQQPDRYRHHGGGDRGDRCDNGHRATRQGPVEQHDPDQPGAACGDAPEQVHGDRAAGHQEQAEGQHREAEHLRDDGHRERVAALRRLASGEVGGAPDERGRGGEEQ